MWFFGGIIDPKRCRGREHMFADGRIVSADVASAEMMAAFSEGFIRQYPAPPSSQFNVLLNAIDRADWSRDKTNPEAKARLHQLVYMSRAREPFSDDDLARLCTNSAARNADRNVTGLLLYDGKRFIQALEGEEQAVRAAMSRIEADPRHYAIEYIADQPIDRRRFIDWTMELSPLTPGLQSNNFLQQVKADVADVEDAQLQAAFIGFAYLANDRATGCRSIAH
jgi:hypothetical protein